MFLINDQPAVDLTPFVDYQSLIALRPHIIKGIVKSWGWTKPGRSEKKILYDPSVPVVMDAMENAVAHPDQFPSHEFLQELVDNDWLASYLRFDQKICYNGLSLNLQYIKDMTNWGTGREDPANVCRTPAYDNFTFLFDWLKDQNIFQAPGRSVIYISEANMNSVEHFDRPKHLHRDDVAPTQFIWLSLDDRKNLYVRDADTDEKHYVDYRIMTFDDRNFHCVESCPWACFSIRIDGFFTREFLEKTGLNQHFDKYQ